VIVLALAVLAIGATVIFIMPSLSYEVFDQILAQPNLAHMRESIPEDYGEFCREAKWR
jgi:hypothetical protein